MVTNVEVPGFRFSAVSAGIRKDGRVDVALAVCDSEASVAGLFTRNVVRAAPVLVASERVRGGKARAFLVNSGCANACTGDAGLAASRESTAALAGALGVAPELVLPASTGVIGALLPAERIAAQAGELVGKLSTAGAPEFATAIMTTDRWPKVAEATVRTTNKDVRVLAIGKGAGMIHPDVGPPHATMLVFVFTDAASDASELQRALELASAETLNACSVDGDTSTNDTVLAMASGASGVPLGAEALAPAFYEVLDKIARSMIQDGEGSKHIAELKVSGLADAIAARRVATTIATSLLVKTALFGEDCNWGRILGAAGRAGVWFELSQVSLRIGGVEIVRNGMGVGKQAEALANEVLKAPEYTLELSLGDGPGTARYLMSDLGHEYVNINADYRS